MEILWCYLSFNFSHKLALTPWNLSESESLAKEHTKKIVLLSSRHEDMWLSYFTTSGDVFLAAFYHGTSPPPPEGSSLPSLDFPDFSPELFEACCMFFRNLKRVPLAEHFGTILFKVPYSLVSSLSGLF